MKKVAVLSSSHEEVARIDVNKLDWVYATPTTGEDLIKVIAEGETYWCDEIEFVSE